MKFFLVASRIVGFKGVDLAIGATKKMGIPLKIVGEYAGIYTEQEKIRKIAGDNVEFLGRVSDDDLRKLYREAEAFLALAKDEDFGMTVVEAMSQGTPVIAFKSGGYMETVVEGKTGVFFEEYTVESLIKAIKSIKLIKFNKNDLQKQAQKFSKEIFMEKMQKLISQELHLRS